MPYGDIKHVDEKNIPNHDILCCGFPCQSFSNAGKKLAFKDARGLLFDNIVRILSYKKPKIAILENVKHIKHVSDGQVYQYVYDHVESIGYSIFDIELSPDQFGIPQHRHRIIFILIRNDITYDKSKILSNIEQNKSKYYDKNAGKKVLLDNVDSRYLIPLEILNVLTAWNEFIKICQQVGEIVSPVDIGYFYDLLDSVDVPDWKRHYINKNKAFYNKYSNLIDKWYKQYKDVLSLRSIYRKLEWQTGTLDGSLFDYYIQIRQSGIRVKKTNTFPALVAIVQTSIIAKEQRYIVNFDAS